jgi:hypothetical protein
VRARAGRTCDKGEALRTSEGYGDPREGIAELVGPGKKGRALRVEVRDGREPRVRVRVVRDLHS